MQIRQIRRIRRHKRVRAKIFGTKEKPRLCVFRSNKHVYVQLVDDNKGKILAVASDSELKQKTKSKEQRTKMDVIKEVGKLIAQKAIEKKIEKVVFDRGGYQYHGKVKALADGAREGGLKF